MNRKEKIASKLFYQLHCNKSYIIDFKSHVCTNLATDEVLSLNTLFDRYTSNCYYKLFDSKELTRFFINIKNNVGESSIEITQNVNGKPTSIRLELVFDGKDRFKAHLFEMKTPARIDKLTGLYNADEFYLDMGKLSRQPLDMDLAILTFDINGLKRKNDEFGHPIGNELIKAAAECINATYYTSGKCYRIGGDEFAVIAYLPLNEVLRKKEYFDYLTSTYKSENITEVSLSYGCATVQEYPKISIMELYTRSDEIQYEDKNRYYDGDKTRKRGTIEQ